MSLSASHIETIPKLLESSSTRKLAVLHLRGNNLGIDGAMAIAQGLIDNKTLKLLDLSSNRLGSKGVMLLCEALRDNQTIQSLFLNTNGISSEGAYALSDLLLDKNCHLQELHLAWNLVCGTGLNSIFTGLAITNRKLKYLDVSYNFVDITVIHALRCMLERNPCLKYLAVSDLYKFNSRAVEALIKSLQMNTALKMMDLKAVTQEFYSFLVESVNNSKRQDPIDFRRDEKYLRTRATADTQSFSAEKHKSRPLIIEDQEQLRNTADQFKKQAPLRLKAKDPVKMARLQNLHRSVSAGRSKMSDAMRSYPRTVKPAARPKANQTLQD